MSTFDVYIEKAKNDSPQGREQLAQAIGKRYGLDPKILMQHLTRGRLRVKAKVDRAKAEGIQADLQSLGAIVSVCPSSTTQTRSPEVSVATYVPGLPGAKPIPGAQPTPANNKTIMGMSPAVLPPPPKVPAQTAPKATSAPLGVPSLALEEDDAPTAVSDAPRPVIHANGALPKLALEEDDEDTSTSGTMYTPETKTANQASALSLNATAAPPAAIPAASQERTTKQNASVSPFGMDEEPLELADRGPVSAGVTATGAADSSFASARGTPPPMPAPLDQRPTDSMPQETGAVTAGLPVLRAPLSKDDLLSQRVLEPAKRPKSLRELFWERPLARIVAGILVSAFVGLVMSGIYVKMVKRGNYERIGKDVAAFQSGDITLSAWQNDIPEYRKRAVDERMTSERTQMIVLSLLIWAATGGGFGFLWFRKLT